MKKKYTIDDSFPSGESLALHRRVKRIAGNIAIVCAFGLSIACLLATFAGERHGFTVKIEGQKNLDGLTLLTDLEDKLKSKDETRYFYNEPSSDSIIPTTASSIVRARQMHVDTPEEQERGRRVFKDSMARDIGLSYTFYLKNSSTKEGRSYVFYLGLDSHSTGNSYNVANPYSYLRILLFQSDVWTGEEEIYVYAAPHDFGQGTKEGGSNDLRECLSTYLIEDDLRYPTYFIDGIGYCQHFGQNNELIRKEGFIEQNTIKRYEVLIYYEGEDPDCRGVSPDGYTISLSARFGG